MNFKFDDKDYDSNKLSDNGKLYLSKLQNINAKEQQTKIEELEARITALETNQP